MAEPQTIFRFITIRNPRKPTGAEIETGFARYDPAIHAPLVEQVISLQPQGPEAVRQALLQFVRSPRYVQATRDLETRFGPLVEWGDWLMSRGGVLTAAELKARIQSTPIPGTPDDERALWDNLLAQTYVGGVSEVREGVINALRALNLKRVRPKLLEDDAVVKRLAAVTVMLPSEASVPATPRREPKPEDKPDLLLRAGRGRAHRERAQGREQGARHPLPDAHRGDVHHGDRGGADRGEGHPDH
jgi:hypothetical protein